MLYSWRLLVQIPDGVFVLKNSKPFNTTDVHDWVLCISLGELVIKPIMNPNTYMKDSVVIPITGDEPDVKDLSL